MTLLPPCTRQLGNATAHCMCSDTFSPCTFSRTSGETLLSLICDILDFSRIEAQKLLLEERPFLLEDALERALQICSMNAAKKRINVACLVANDVPRRLVGDMGRLQQVLLNALGNSLKFTPDNGVVQLQCSAIMDAPDGPLLHIAVVDNGIGISASGLAKLFTSFSQVDSSPNRKYDGAGLGLAISRRLCEAMGGTMRAESPGLGMGSTFHITVTLQQAAADAVVEGAMVEVPPLSLSRRRVLVADACSPVRTGIGRWLRAWGAADVAEAACPDSLAAMLAQGPSNSDGARWDAVIVESTSPFLKVVLAHLDGTGPACAQDTCDSDGDGAVGMDSGAGEPGALKPQEKLAPQLQVVAMAWPAMPGPPTDVRAPGASRAAYGIPLVAPPVPRANDTEEVCAQDLVPGCISISKPVRQSRLRDALSAAFVNLDNEPDGEALAAGNGGAPAHGRGLRASTSMASFASCGDFADAPAPGAAAATAAQPRTLRKVAQPAPAAAPAASLRVLLAEDHIINQKVVMSLLSRYGHNVACVANDGVDAIEKLRAVTDGPDAFDGAVARVAVFFTARWELTRRSSRPLLAWQSFSWTWCVMPLFLLFLLAPN